MPVRLDVVFFVRRRSRTSPEPTAPTFVRRQTVPRKQRSDTKAVHARIWDDHPLLPSRGPVVAQEPFEQLRRVVGARPGIMADLRKRAPTHRRPAQPQQQPMPRRRWPGAYASAWRGPDTRRRRAPRADESTRSRTEADNRYERRSIPRTLTHAQVSDSYLVTVAMENGGKLATLDRDLSARFADHCVLIR